MIMEKFKNAKILKFFLIVNQQLKEKVARKMKKYFGSLKKGCIFASSFERETNTNDRVL